MAAYNSKTKETHDFAFRPTGKRLERLPKDDKYWTSIHMQKTIAREEVDVENMITLVNDTPLVQLKKYIKKYKLVLPNIVKGKL